MGRVVKHIAAAARVDGSRLNEAFERLSSLPNEIFVFFKRRDEALWPTVPNPGPLVLRA